MAQRIDKSHTRRAVGEADIDQKITDEKTSIHTIAEQELQRKNRFEK